MKAVPAIAEVAVEAKSNENVQADSVVNFSSSTEVNALTKSSASIEFDKTDWFNTHTYEEVDIISEDNLKLKGYFLKDRYVILDDHDFEEAAPEKNKVIELENFVDIKEINPIYYETSYYTEPEKQGVKAYALLLKALEKSKKAGVGRFVLRNAALYVSARVMAGLFLIVLAAIVVSSAVDHLQRWLSPE